MCRPGPEADPAHRPGRLLPGRRAGLASSGCGSATRDLADAQPIPRAPWLDRPGWTTVVAAWSRWRPATACSSTTCWTSPTRRTCTAATSARPRSPRRRSPPRSTRRPGIVRVSRHMDDAECPPFYAESTGIEGRITRWQDIEYHAAVPVPAAQPHRAGRRRCRTPTAATRTPSTSRSSTRSRRRPSTRRTTSGPSPATSRSDDEEVSDFLRENNRTVVMQDVVALERAGAGHRRPSPTATRSCASTSTPAAWPPAASSPGWPRRGHAGGRQPACRRPRCSPATGSAGSTGCPAPTCCAAPATAAPSTRSRTRSSCGSGCSPTPTTIRATPVPPRPEARRRRTRHDPPDPRRRWSSPAGRRVRTDGEVDAAPPASPPPTARPSRPGAGRRRDLPAWEPGAHIDLVLGRARPAVLAVRRPGRPVARWRIAVLREPDGRGGSRVRARRARRRATTSRCAARATTSRSCRRRATCSSPAASASRRSCR